MVEIKEALIIDTPSASAVEKIEKKPRSIAEILTTQLEALQTYHRAVLETDEPEAIHKMRVTTRRAQAALDLLEGELRVRKLKRRLREWRQMLSRVRNYDVFLMLIEKEVTRSRPAYRAQFELVKSIFQKRRAHRAEKARKYFEKIKVNSIAIELGLPIAQPVIEAVADSAVESREAHEAKQSDTGSQKSFAIDEQKVAAHVADRLEQRVAEFHTLAAQAHPATRAEELHQLRIAAKRVRYLLEIISQMGYGDGTRAVAWLRNVQDRIGDWHDLESLEEEIIEIVSHRRFLKEHIAESSRMLQAAAHLQKKKERLVTKLFPVRVPKTIAATSQRMERALRRSAGRVASSNQ
ncbi:MAG TPA: CHAD domain-containing protein [Blastocatellia bacterium]|nr:CHAD domain-containing protein [Blastocatellia bacterium]